MGTKKLIEVALPLEKINAESAREKSIRHGHPSTLHMWWARRPLAAARAVIWSSLVDDPSSHPEKFSTEEDQDRERQRLFKILEELVVWENSNNKDILDSAKKEIFRSNGGIMPDFLDPFSGGGAIPLEAHRLGMKAHAHDLNPVAVLINKAMIEIPPRFANYSAVNPSAVNNLFEKNWYGTAGLVEDIQYYGQKLKEQTFQKIGYLYPEVTLPKSNGGKKAKAIAWIWARTIKCPNPACRCEMPLIRSFDLSKKKGNQFHISYQIDGTNITYSINSGLSPVEGTIGKTGAKCPCCGNGVSFEHIREESKQGKIESKMVAVVAEGHHGRAYLSPDEEQILASHCDVPDDPIEGALPQKALGFRVQSYGINEWKQLFTNRQQLMLTSFCDQLSEIQKEVYRDAVLCGLRDDHIFLENGGCGATAYSQAVSTYLAFSINKMTNYHCNLSSWHSTGEKMQCLFARQAIPMTWDYAEGNPFSSSSGCYDNMLEWVTKVVRDLPAASEGCAIQHDAHCSPGITGLVVSTDPPYYDNIGYADLSDFFYVWLRRMLKSDYPQLFSTLLVPKEGELIANPFRCGDSEEAAKVYFESGMLQAFSALNHAVCDDIPLTVYYAFKETESNTEGEFSSGWETMLSAIIKAGFMITGTWPMRTEMATRARGRNSNALASSVVLVCRKRSEDAPQTTRRNLVNILRRELRTALKKLQDSNIAPVDLAQSAIGPGMGVFSRYRRVLEADGSVMTVRSALQLINEEVDLYFNEQVGSMDAASRFCVDLYTQYAYNNIKYGEAEILANAKSTSIPMMASHGVLYAKAGVVHLVERADLPEKVDTDESSIWMLTQQLTRAMAKGGIESCAQIVYNLFGSNAESAKDLAYRLYTIAERKGWTEEAYAYNALVVAWPDIQSRAAALKAETPEQLTLF